MTTNDRDTKRTPQSGTPRSTGQGEIEQRAPEKPVMGMRATDWSAVEALALELAAMAGQQIVAAVGRQIAVSYKGEPGSLSDPVSEIDRSVEMAIREQVDRRFPEHVVLGEEFDGPLHREHEVLWAVDPIDGTSNFVNGFPLFSASIGVLHRGRPVVGALWCSTSHAVRSGVYHAHDGGPLCFDGEPVLRAERPDVRRRLAGDPGNSPANAPWDFRKTGSAAIECAFAAVGLFELVRFERPNIWDVAGGVALARAAGCSIMTRGSEEGDTWQDFVDFRPRDAGPDDGINRNWRHALLIGAPKAVETAATSWFN